MAAAPGIEPTGAATIVNENFAWLHTRTAALETVTQSLDARIAAQQKNSLLLNARQKALAIRLTKMENDMTTRLSKIRTILGDVKSDSDSDTETDDEAGLGDEFMAVDESADNTPAALRW